MSSTSAKANRANYLFRALVIVVLNAAVVILWNYLLLGNVNANPRFPPNTAEQLWDLAIMRGPHAIAAIMTALALFFLFTNKMRLALVSCLAPLGLSLTLICVIAFVRLLAT